MVVKGEIGEKPRRIVEVLARGSYIAKAILYGGIAVFVFRFALGSGGPNPNREEVLEQFTSNPFGKILIGLIALSLVGHTLWRLFEIWNDPYEKGKGFEGWIYRLNYLLSAITYAGLAISATKLLFVSNNGQGGDQKQIWVAQLLQLEGGDWLVMLVGALIIIWGGLQIYKGISGNVYKSLKIDHLNGFWKVFLRVSSLLGFLTLGSILFGTGWYLIKGAWVENPKWVKNMDDLIKALQAFPGGTYLQLLAGVGLLLIAFFMAAMARYFPVKTAEARG